MHFNDNQRSECNRLKFSELFTHKLNSVLELILQELVVVSDTLDSIFNCSLFQFLSPVDLASVEYTLTRMLLNPFITMYGAVLKD